MAINFETECYGEDKRSGGTSSCMNEWDYGTGQTHSKSAYMLVYEKRNKSEARILIDDELIQRQNDLPKESQDEIDRRERLRKAYEEAGLSTESFENKSESLECDSTAISRELIPCLVPPANYIYTLDNDEREKFKLPLPIFEEGDEKFIRVPLDEI